MTFFSHETRAKILIDGLYSICRIQLFVEWVLIKGYHASSCLLCRTIAFMPLSISNWQRLKHQESVLRSTATSFRFSGAALTCVGKSTSMFGGAKYMCSDIIQMIVPNKSYSMTRKIKHHWWYRNQPAYAIGRKDFIFDNLWVHEYLQSRIEVKEVHRQNHC